MSGEIYVLIEHLQGQVLDISYILLAQARELAGNDAQVTAILLGHQAQALTAELAADEVFYYDHPLLETFTAEAYWKVLAGLLEERKPRLMLFGETTIGSETAGGLSMRLGLPLVSHCQKIVRDGAVLRWVSQLFAGKMLAEGDLPEGTALVTMQPGAFKPEQGKSRQSPKITPQPPADLSGLRTSVKQIIQPSGEDVDITRLDVLVSVGRGIQQKENIELAQALAESLNTVLAGSRPVVDQGWLPVSRLVGKSGKAVKPKLYLALGISGAPEHVEALGNVEMIVAINTDPNAPIFNLARFGATVDALDLLPVLSEKVQQAKGG
jgi:electron transfer flavoprotein alpha subunit